MLSPCALGGHGGVRGCMCLSTNQPRADALFLGVWEGCGIPLWVALPLGLEPRLDGLTVRCTASYARGDWFVRVLWVYHLTLFAQYAADILPLAMLAAWRALKDLFRAEPSGEPDTPFCPNLISFVVLPCLARTACDLVGWLGVDLGLLYPLKVSDPRLMLGIIFPCTVVKLVGFQYPKPNQ